MDSASFDYVIVGAGSAGCVLANRLSTDTASDVLLLEAGGSDDKREIKIPVLSFRMYKTETDWEYYTVPQPEMRGREMYWPRGKTLGGSSSINTMLHTRGHPSDYDRWADLGNEGWTYADISPYFERSEHFTGTEGDSTDYGTDGPLHVTDQRSPRDISRSFIDAAIEVGHERNPNFNQPPQEGFGLFHVNQRNGRRHSVADAYLKPILDRPNLTVETGARVTRVLFEDDRAVGVRYEQEGTTRVDATQEVVLCGGAVNSPHLLMLSGIGPSDHLREHDIDVTTDLPGVGRNLQDHLTVFVVYEVTDGTTLDDADSLTRLPVNLAKFYLLGRGPFTSPIGEAAGFVRTGDELPAPDLEIVTIPAHPRTHTFDKPPGIHAINFVPVQLRPDSRGRIMLRSNDPFKAPAIDPQYLTEPADIEMLIEGIRRCREIAHAAPLDEQLGDELWPGEDIQSDEALAEYIRKRANSEYHPVGTCKMGDDDLAVVDDRLRVHEVEGLRVVDASIMPTIIGGHTNAPTVMIAEKAAEMIKETA